MTDGSPIRQQLSPSKRALPLEHTIDPGFVNRRAVQSVLGPAGIKVVDEMTTRLPPHPEWQASIRLDHIYTDVMLAFCNVNRIPTLAQLLSAGAGRMFCSTEQLLPNGAVYESERTSSEIKPAGTTEYRVLLEYSTKHIHADTTRTELTTGALQSIIAVFNRKEGNSLYFRPLIIGAPWLRSEDPAWADEIIWWTQDFFEHFIEDFCEFDKVNDEPVPDSVEPMKLVSENAFKVSLARILGDPVTKDWGGEQSDHFTAHLHLGGRRVSGAFLLKGPARFAPMGLNHLGKNNDQIYRLAQEPADVLFVQHSHEITPPVRATLRAFAVHPGRSRRYCLIDGRDSLRLLRAYGLYDEAVRVSQ
ncbi:MAG: hypothetical protein ACK55X_11645 [Synechococcaceae cyanobacterium]|jgi:hypothetical protein